ncbi:3-keto-disaccharide hydrolase [Lacipirellula sp.]|uniref:3-keto-disaccharide hydrolase n=1 Tax=Lacipirellula sp. TaxID=2691419 RepID=UPI003D1115C3
MASPSRACQVALLVSLLVAPSLAAAAEVAKPNQLTPEQIAEGWISLFDGETLFGWTPTSKADWKVDDGAIAASEGDEGFLMTNSEFGDYELHIEFKAPATTNSGVFLRTPLKPTDPAKDCYELNIAPDDNPFPTASLVARHKWEMPWTSYPPSSVINEQPAIPASIAEGWFPLDVRVEGDKVSVRYLGDEKYEYTYIDPTGLRRGHIGLQFREGPVAFRNIRLKPLGLKPMLNGKDLAGWNDDQKKTSKFEIVASTDPSGPLPLEGRVREGGLERVPATPPSPALPSGGREPDDKHGTGDFELRVTNGSGQLESDATYGDFTMQFDTRVDGDGLNSGVFFRCIPREYMNGYECQIHNGMKEGDPTKPSDFGTGAIYRRIPARRVNARDHEWFTTTIVATGPHIAVWVNGLQVTDWTDPRPPHDNPRSGLRTAAGTISLQGHDPTTDIRFRNMRIGELPGNTNHEDAKSTKEGTKQGE